MGGWAENAERVWYAWVMSGEKDGCVGAMRCACSCRWGGWVLGKGFEEGGLGPGGGSQPAAQQSTPHNAETRARRPACIKKYLKAEALMIHQEPHLDIGTSGFGPRKRSPKFTYSSPSPPQAVAWMAPQEPHLVRAVHKWDTAIMPALCAYLRENPVGLL